MVTVKWYRIMPGSLRTTVPPQCLESKSAQTCPNQVLQFHHRPLYAPSPPLHLLKQDSLKHWCGESWIKFEITHAGSNESSRWNQSGQCLQSVFCNRIIDWPNMVCTQTTSSPAGLIESNSGEKWDNYRMVIWWRNYYGIAGKPLFLPGFSSS